MLYSCVIYSFVLENSVINVRIFVCTRKFHQKCNNFQLNSKIITKLYEYSFVLENFDIVIPVKPGLCMNPSIPGYPYFKFSHCVATSPTSLLSLF